MYLYMNLYKYSLNKNFPIYMKNENLLVSLMRATTLVITIKLYNLFLSRYVFPLKNNSQF